MSAYAAGIDAGTTNIQLIVLDLEHFCVVERFSSPVRRILSGNPYAFEQDAEGIAVSATKMLEKVSRPLSSVGITGQVHGIVYTDEALRTLSPLYSWLDSRGVEPWQGSTPQAALEERTGSRLAAGAGLLTHYANRLFGRVPKGAGRVMGITELVAGRLTGAPLSRTDDSILASFGATEPSGESRRALLDEVFSPQCPAFLEAAPPFTVAGRLKAGGAPVAYPVGDNQAGFFGALPHPENSCLISIGTSGQISFFSKDAVCPSGMELRPYLGKGWLQVGATLAAGKSYEALASFVKEIIRASGGQAGDEEVFALLKRAAKETAKTSLVFETTLGGTRRDTAKRGSITGIGLDNFTLGNLALAAIDGIVRELAGFTRLDGIPFESLTNVALTGSAPAKNELFVESVRRQFKRPVSEHVEGAAFGAAVIGAVAAGLINKDESTEVIERFHDSEE